MNEIIPPLSEDEMTVLEIASKGESMAPVGRWEAPTKRLAELGYLRSLDTFNYVITDAGRARQIMVDKEYDEAVGKFIGIVKRIIHDS